MDTYYATCLVFVLATLVTALAPML